jgi:hypothetical protein
MDGCASDSKPLRRSTIDLSAQPEAWGQFWTTSRDGAIDLGADDPVANALRRHWQEQIPWLMHCNGVVDVGSGPAVLPRLLLALQPALLAKLQWICIDRARIERGTDVPATVRLMDDVDFGASSPPPGEPLPQGLVSNFGIEYLDTDALAGGCARWLAPGGRLHALVHASGSIIDRVSAAAADDIVWALDEVKLFDAVRVLLGVMATLPTDPIDRMMHGVGERDAYNRAVNQLKQRMETRRAVSAPLIDMLNSMGALSSLALRGNAEPAQRALASRHDALRGEVLRLQAMQRCALDDDRVLTLVQALGQEGITTESPSRLDCPLGNVAWVVSGRRN